MLGAFFLKKDFVWSFCPKVVDRRPEVGQSIRHVIELAAVLAHGEITLHKVTKGSIKVKGDRTSILLTKSMWTCPIALVRIKNKLLVMTLKILEYL
jgi:hypothetical protein